MATGGLEKSRQHSLIKFFDPTTPSMRKGRDGGEKQEEGGGDVEKK